VQAEVSNGVTPVNDFTRVKIISDPTRVKLRKDVVMTRPESHCFPNDPTWVAANDSWHETKSFLQNLKTS